MANINAGVITVIWSVTPLFVALADYFMFQQSLTYNYIIGMVLMMASAVLLSLNSLIFAPNGGQLHKVQIIPSWIAVVIAFMNCFVFTARIILYKRLTAKEYGINFVCFSLFSSSFLVFNTLIFIAGLFYWRTHHFDK